jgi:alpha-N-arabinofuranosidase
MFSGHLGDQILTSTLDSPNPRLFESVTADSNTGRLHLKLVNASSAPQQVAIKITGAAHIRPAMTLTTLRGVTTKDTNSITAPKHMVPVITHAAGAAASFHHTVPAYSIQVLDIDRAQGSPTQRQ